MHQFEKLQTPSGLFSYCHTRVQLGISALLEILQACKLDHEVDIKSDRNHFYLLLNLREPAIIDSIKDYHLKDPY